MERRRSTSTSDWAASPTETSPSRDAHLVDDQPRQRGLDVEHLDARAVAELDDALVGELAAALGVERRAVEHELDLLARPARS